MLLATTQGTAVQTDDGGRVAQYLHKPLPNAGAEQAYIELSGTRHGIVRTQEGTNDEAAAAKAAGRAASAPLGTAEMGKGFNRLATVQLPLGKRLPPPGRVYGDEDLQEEEEEDVGGAGAYWSSDDEWDTPAPAPAAAVSAGRVSYGDVVGPVPSLRDGIARAARERATITVQYFYVVPHGRAPTADEVRQAVGVIQEAYAAANTAPAAVWEPPVVASGAGVASSNAGGSAGLVQQLGELHDGGPDW